MVALRESVPSATVVGGWSDQKHTKVSERKGESE